MSNSSSAQGALQRSGIQTRRKKLRINRGVEAKRRHIRESFVSSFEEQGKDEKQKTASGTQKGRVYLVTIIEEGLGNSKDMNYYSASALQSGTQLFNGAKAYCDHPDAISEKTLPERSMRDVVGWYSDCFTDKNPQTGKVRLRGKLHMFPDAKWLSDKIDTILTDPDPSVKNLFGISINAIGKTRPATMNGQQVNYVEEYQRVDSADVVTEPAARGGFDRILESRRGRKQVSSGRAVSRSAMSKRTREAAALSSEKTKEIADSLVSAYNSDNPDELKQATFEAAKQLHAASSISGRGPGQVNEEQYSNINPSEESDDMQRPRRTKASAGRPMKFRKKKHLKAAAGTGPDNEDEGEPEPSDIENELEESSEADVEDEEGTSDLGDFDDFGNSSKKTIKASRRNTRTAEAAEAFEDEDEGLEDEDEDEMGAPPPQMAAPTGGGAPGSSRAIASHHEADDDDDDDDDDDLDDELDEAEEGLEGFEDEDEGLEDEDEHDMGGGGGSPAPQMGAPGTVAESGRRNRRMRRGQEADGNASFSGGLGRSGHKALPKGADPSRGYEDSDEDFGKRDDSTSGVGKSYKLKTSRFRKNKLAKRVAHEANRRIELLEKDIRRLKESNRGKDRKIVLYRGKMRFAESVRTGHSLLREAVRQEIITPSLAKEISRELYGLNREEQVGKIRVYARLLESAQEGTEVLLQDRVEGAGARGGVVFRESAGAENSELISGLAESGIPMKRQSR